jgi:hypothetical protein
LVWDFFVLLELGVVVVVAAVVVGHFPFTGSEPSGHGVVVVVAAVVVGHFPFTGSEPSGHGVVVGVVGVVVGVVPPLLPLPSLLPLLLSPGLLLLLLLLDEVVSELCFFFAKTELGSSDTKTIDVIEERRMKIVSIEIILEFCLVFVLNILIVSYFYF